MDDAGRPDLLVRVRSAWGSPARLLRSLVAGAVAAIWAVFNSVAFAGLIYAGPLAPFLPLGIVALLATFTVVAAAVALGSELLHRFPLREVASKLADSTRLVAMALDDYSPIRCEEETRRGLQSAKP